MKYQPVRDIIFEVMAPSGQIRFSTHCPECGLWMVPVPDKADAIMKWNYHIDGHVYAAWKKP